MRASATTLPADGSAIVASATTAAPAPPASVTCQANRLTRSPPEKRPAARGSRASVRRLRMRAQARGGAGGAVPFGEVAESVRGGHDDDQPQAAIGQPSEAVPPAPVTGVERPARASPGEQFGAAMPQRRRRGQQPGPAAAVPATGSSNRSRWAAPASHSSGR